MIRTPQFSRRVFGIACGILLAVVVVATATAQNGFFDRYLPAASEEQVEDDIGARTNPDLPIHIVTPPPADGGSVTNFGPYRLIPFGFVGDLPAEAIQIPKGVQTDDPSVVRQSPLYREVNPDVLPERMQITEASTGAGTTESEVHLRYQATANPSQAIDVVLGRPSQRPIDVNLPKSGVGVWSTRIVEGLYAIIVEGRATPPGGVQPLRLTLEVRMSSGDREAWIRTNSGAYDAEALIQIARDMLK